MSKAVFVMDMPKCCKYCPLGRTFLFGMAGAAECKASKMINGDEKTKPDWCPLLELPEEMPYSGLEAITAETAEERTSQAMEEAVARGYNLCLRRITGGCKDGN